MSLKKQLLPPYGIPTVALLTAVFIVVVDNRLFWHKLAERLPLESFAHWQLTLTLGAILTLLFTAVFTLASFRPVFKPFLVGVLLIAAGISYFATAFGTIIDKSMIHNILETNAREAGELVTWSLAWHLLLYGLVPAALVVAAPVHYPQWRRGLLLRAGVAAACLALAAGLFMIDFKGLVLFGRENRELQVFLNPSYPVYALVKVVNKQHLAHAAEPLQSVAADAVRAPAGHRSVVVLVVGETARASELPANGYPRNTTPYTAGRDVISFTDVESCGTATAVSVPCMFSPLGRDQFNVDRAANSENLLDVLQRTGVKALSSAGLRL